MKTNTFKIAVQKGQAGFYAQVTLSILVERGISGLSVNYANGVDAWWRPAVEFGVAYGMEQLPKAITEGRAIRVKVDRVDWMPADTSLILVAMATTQCLWAIFEFVPESAPKLDVDAGGVFFPKRGFWPKKAQ